MKNKVLLIGLLFLLLVGCNSKEENEKDKPVKSDIDAKVEETLSKMTLDEKIGQMITIFYRADTVDNTLKSAITDVKPGGFILFAENMSSYSGTLKFIKEVKSLSEIPMFISIDEEGGRVQRLR